VPISVRDDGFKAKGAGVAEDQRAIAPAYGREVRR
jgi:hypothetical protein